MRTKAFHLDRKNLIVDGKKLKRLQKILKTKSESEAVRLAINRTLDAEEAIAALKRLRKRGTWGKNLTPDGKILGY
jgi:hypothetical protein